MKHDAVVLTTKLSIQEVKSMTHQTITDRLLSTYASLPFIKSCDGFKAGNPQDNCTGIVTTCVLSPEVIRKAAQLGCNLIVVHEPTFFTHDDDTDWLKGNAVYEQIIQMLSENSMAVWRNHDHMHAARPDEIMAGVLQELGWTQYVQETNYGFRTQVTIPEITLHELAQYLKTRLNLQTGRIVGDPDARVSRIAFCGHIFPSWNDEERIPTQLLSRDDVDVLIPGEIIDWTVVPYVRDAAQLGMSKALIHVGHFNLEEPGMRYLAQKIAKLVPELPVHYVPASDPYFFV